MVVSNSSPLIALHRIGQIILLSDVFKEVTIPPAVLRELEQGRDALAQDVHSFQ